MSSAMEWRKRISGLREMARLAKGAERERKLTELADRWEKVADEVEGGDEWAAAFVDRTMHSLER